MIQIGISTYNRPAKVLTLLKDIVKSLGDEQYRVVLINDGSTFNYDKVKAYMENNIPLYHYVKREMNGGRYGYWKIQNDIMEYLNMVLSDDDYIFILPDDVKLVKGFFEKSINLLDDSGAASINLLNVTDGKLVTQWVNNDVQEVLCNGTLLLTSGYVDMGMVISGKVFKHLGFLSSGFVSSTGTGVGRQYTVKLRRAGQIYQVKHSLLIHGNHDSVLNPNERGRNPMVSNQILPWCRSGNSYTGLKNMNQTHYRK